MKGCEKVEGFGLSLPVIPGVGSRVVGTLRWESGGCGLSKEESSSVGSGQGGFRTLP